VKPSDRQSRMGQFNSSNSDPKVRMDVRMCIGDYTCVCVSFIHACSIAISLSLHSVNCSYLLLSSTVKSSTMIEDIHSHFVPTEIPDYGPI